MENRLAKLALAIGRTCAERELKWMRMKQSQPDRLLDMLYRRLCGEPLQYILGTTPFGPLELYTRPPTLIPRTETEDWTLRLAQHRPTGPVRILDLCTGSGCIPLLLCHLWPTGTRAIGIDISPDAIQLATDNTALVRKNRFTPIQGDIHDHDLLHRLAPFDVITANPPYIPLDDYQTLPSDVREYEDRAALVGGRDGLDYYHTIAALLPALLAPKATIALEVGHDQAHAVRHILLTHLPHAETEIWRDPWDKERVVVARTA